MSGILYDCLLGSSYILTSAKSLATHVACNLAAHPFKRKRMSSNQYRRKTEQARSKIAQLSKDKGRLATKRASLTKKMVDANDRAMKTSNTSTLKSKLREAERAAKELVRVENDIGKIETKIAQESKKLGDAEKSLAKEQKREAGKREQVAERLADSTKQKISQLDSTLDTAVHDIEALKNLPKTIQVLFLAANPLDEDELRLDEEARSIHEMIRKSEHSDSVKLESRWAVRPLDALQAINEVEPTVVHFSGHGSDRDEIVFQNEQGNAKVVSLAAIVQMMKASSDKIRLVFFNSCYSRGQAEAVVEHVEAAIGMNDSIGDEAACVFASQFYSAIGFGKSVQTAFEQGKAALMLEDIREENTPELFVADGVDSKQLVIVQPKGYDNSL